jgi:tRNA pseudouridine38-40 synthase
MAEKRDNKEIDPSLTPQAKRQRVETGDQGVMEGVEEPPAEGSSGATQVDAEGPSTGEEPGASRKKSRKSPRQKEGNQSKGRRERRSATKEEEEANREKKRLMAEQGIEPPPRLPKRQSALLIGFCGSGYKGMQMLVILLGTAMSFVLLKMTD